MIRIGLTGSIGMGKSTVAALFAAEGLPLFDADAVVHALQAPGGALLPAIEAAFPGTTVNGTLDRAALGRIVFADPAERARLEAIVHPAVAAARAAFLRTHRHARLVLLDIPLLFETGADAQVDVIVVVSAARPIQRARVLARPGMTPERLTRIEAAQLPDRAKRRRAHHVIDTGRPLVLTRLAVRRLVACLRGRPGRYAGSCARSSSTPRRRG